MDRPGFNRYHFCPNRLVFFYVDGPVHNVVPHRWVVGSVHHVDLDLDTPRQRRVSLILGSGFQLVRLALCIHRNVITHTGGTQNTMIIPGIVIDGFFFFFESLAVRSDLILRTHNARTTTHDDDRSRHDSTTELFSPYSRESDVTALVCI